MITYDVQGLYGLEWETIAEFDNRGDAERELDTYRRNEYGESRTEFRITEFEG